MRTPVMTPAAVLLGLTLALLAACNGGGSGAGDPAADVAELCKPLARVKSFTYTFDYRLETTMLEDPVDPDIDIGDYALQPDSPDFLIAQTLDGTVHTPDKLDVIVRTEGGDDTHLIFYEDRQWAFLGGRWTPSSQPVPFPVLEICDAALDEVDLEGVEAEEGSVNGEDTLRYELTGLKLDTVEQIWGATSDMGRILDTFDLEVWLTRKGEVPVRIVSRSEGAYPSGRPFTMDLTLDVRDLNDAPTVEPPEG
jgi:hypothetical protein